jgi:hypothetical protein
MDAAFSDVALSVGAAVERGWVGRRGCLAVGGGRAGQPAAEALARMPWLRTHDRIARVRTHLPSGNELRAMWDTKDNI